MATEVMESRTFRSRSAEDTHRIAATLAEQLLPGDVVLLEGDLGVGKTEFAKGILSAFGWEGLARSPTFPIMIPYSTDPPVLHVDLYRVETIDGLGLDEALEGCVGLVEWPDRAPEIGMGRRSWVVAVRLVGDEREILMSGPCA